PADERAHSDAVLAPACGTGAPWSPCTDGSPTTSRPPERHNSPSDADRSAVGAREPSMTRWIPRLLGAATVGAGVAAAGYVGLVTGACPLNLGIGRRVRPLGPQVVEMAAPREVVFDVIAEPYLGRAPRAGPAPRPTGGGGARPPWGVLRRVRRAVSGSGPAGAGRQAAGAGAGQRHG